MISLEEFHQDFLQSILSETESRGLMKPQAFFENVCEELVGSGDLTTNYTAAEYVKKGVEVHGYDFDEERKILSLIVHQFFQEDEIQTLTRSLIDTKFNRLKGFFRMIAQREFNKMEHTSDEYSMAYNIAQYVQNKLIDRIRLIILTDGKMTKTLTDLPSESIADIPLDFRVIDVDYIYRIYLSEFANQKFEIDIELPCLKVSTASDEYQSYLSVIPGDVLAEIYERYGQKLFEQNVRTFLQFRGAANLGLKNTIEFKPEMFFAYNNGITATASDVEFNREGNITKIVNFQIVNGGQTTSSIYAARKSLKLDISKVSVQMKLSVVKNKDQQHTFVSDVSRYANTQNKVNASDFFSNSPFHKEMKDYSRRLWVSTSAGSQRRTHWFYERARGEYLNEQRYLTSTQKKQFLRENPKHQYLEKTLLAKSEVSWLQKPAIVSKGAQESFKYFAESVTKRIEDDNLSISERYFKDCVSRVILFREVEKLISKSDWYDGGFRAQTVTYSIAYLSYLISQTRQFLNFELIWNEQVLPTELERIMKSITKEVYRSITNPPQGIANVTQWCKKDSCWEKVASLRLGLVIDSKLLVGREEVHYVAKTDRAEKIIETGIQMQEFVVLTDSPIWKHLHEYFSKSGAASGISATQSDILHKMAIGSLGLPSEKQSKILYQLFTKAKQEGFTAH
jgi:hypothetical protein